MPALVKQIELEQGLNRLVWHTFHFKGTEKGKRSQLAW